MIGIKGEPFADSFQWVKWRPSREELLQLGATRVISDRRAAKLGIVVELARRTYHASQRGQAVDQKPAGR